MESMHITVSRTTPSKLFISTTSSVGKHATVFTILSLCNSLIIEPVYSSITTVYPPIITTLLRVC